MSDGTGGEGVVEWAGFLDSATKFFGWDFPSRTLREDDGADAGECWFSGATYVDSADAQAAHTDADEAANLQRLRELLPIWRLRAPARQV